jgi:hypothetical protein
MKKILLMGCGGIGSWLVRFMEFGRRNSIINARIVLADSDKVEPKNLMYSNFRIEDVGKNKATVLSKRYKFKALPKRIESIRQIRPFDLIIIATDNGYSRGMIYSSGKPWIDLRCKGRGYAIFSGSGKLREKSRMLKTIDRRRFADSCQYETDLRSGRVQFGNLVAASIGWQMLLNWLRKERVKNVIGMV